MYENRSHRDYTEGTNHISKSYHHIPTQPHGRVHCAVSATRMSAVLSLGVLIQLLSKVLRVQVGNCYKGILLNHATLLKIILHSFVSIFSET